MIGDLIKKKDLMVGNTIMNRSICFGSTATISYAQIQQRHPQAEDFGLDINSALTVSNSQKIQT
jgi:hypothetical protein